MSCTMVLISQIPGPPERLSGTCSFLHVAALFGQYGFMHNVASAVAREGCCTKSTSHGVSICLSPYQHAMLTSVHRYV